MVSVNDISGWYDEHLTKTIKEISSDHQLSHLGKLMLRGDVTILNKAVDIRSKLRHYRSLGNVTLTARYEGMFDSLMWVLCVGEHL